MDPYDPSTWWAGSSPRMRGKHGPLRSLYLVGRLIPAHAGKTPHAAARKARHRAHPRACGENAAFATALTWYAGSSPRMRGKLELLRLDAAAVRLIPAHAGKTCAVEHVAGHTGAHPRACGENPLTTFVRLIEQGSSPRMRGKRYGLGCLFTGGGLIPAHAGKTKTRHDAVDGDGAHPRACGENLWSRPPTRTATAHPRACGEN